MRACVILLASGLLASGAPAAETITYTYDARGRLITVTRTGPNNTTTTYGYDKADPKIPTSYSGISAVYVTDGKNDRYNGRAIEISKNRVLFGDSVNDFSEGELDFGGIHRFIHDEKGHYSDSFPIFIAETTSSQWTPRGYTCSSIKSGEVIRTVCTSSIGEKFESTYNLNAGLVQIDFYCSATNLQVCNYHVVNSQGFKLPIAP